VFHVIGTCDDLHFVPLCLYINRPWELIDVPRYAFDLPSSCLELCLLFFVEYRVVNNLVRFLK
jgi:hypothetical protein